MSTPIRFTPIVRDLPAAVPFVGPETLERQRGEVFKVRVGANESAFGVSPKAREAMTQALDTIAWYNDPEGFDLRQTIAAQHGVEMAEVCLCAGIDEMLGNIVRMLITPGLPVVTSLGAYPTFNYHVDGFGGVLHRVPYRDDHIDLNAVLDEVRRTDAPLVFFANPDNPMGTWHDAAAVTQFMDALPASTLLVYDEAYVEFAPASMLVPIDTSRPNVLHMRTFSKAHGMAGARIGYAVGNTNLITGVGKIRNHFGVNRTAQIGALASLQDTGFIQSVVQAVAAGRDEYASLAADAGLRSLKSATNFVTIDMDGDGNRAKRMLALLQERGVFVRMPGVAPLDRCIRVSVGTPPERAIVAQAFRDAMAVL